MYYLEGLQGNLYLCWVDKAGFPQSFSVTEQEADSLTKDNIQDFIVQKGYDL